MLHQGGIGLDYGGLVLGERGYVADADRNWGNERGKGFTQITADKDADLRRFWCEG